MSDAKPVGLFVKLAQVMAAVQRVEKKGRNEFHKYDYATEADIVEAVRGALAERSVVLLPSVDEVTVNGTLTTLAMTFTFVDGETGEVRESKWIGCGDDRGDKGAYKAMTGAVKYFLLKTFLIPTGDDPESDVATDARAKDAAPRERQTVRTKKAEPLKPGQPIPGEMNAGQKSAIERLMQERRGIKPDEIGNAIENWPFITAAEAGRHIAELQKD